MENEELDFEKVIKEAEDTAKKSTDPKLLQQEKPKFLGKKGTIALAMKSLKNLDIEKRKEFGKKSNEAKERISAIFDARVKALQEEIIKKKINSETLDVTLPGVDMRQGSIHPLTKTIEEIEDLFIGLGYSVAEGPEIETDEYCFEMLNLPKGHPAREMQDTFYINPELLLRSQTSPVQVRTMLEKKREPIKIICPGKVYRRDADDATHSHQFIQCEGLVLGSDITFANLKGALLEMAREMFGPNREIRLRPSYFPFTEPSVEVDVSCASCGGKGCSMCHNTGWIEVLGAGMVNDNVLRMSGYDPEKIQGFAFGIGVERISMLRDHVDDIRNYYTNDVRFLKQFKEVL